MHHFILAALLLAASVPVTSDSFTKNEVARLVQLMHKERLVAFTRAGTLILGNPSTEITDGLSALGDDAIAPLTAAFATAPSDSARYGIGLGLVKLGPPGESALTDLLLTDAKGRRWLLQALAGRTSSAIVGALRKLVADRDHTVAERAILDLAESEDDAGLAAIRRLVAGPDAALAKKAALALAFQKDATGVAILIDELRTAKAALALFQTMKGLGLSGAPEAVAPLLALFVGHANKVKPGEPAGRVTGLGDFEARFRRMSPSERGMLIAAQAQGALAALKHRAPRPEVVALLAHRNPHVRRMALEVLGACGDESAAGPIAKVLEAGLASGSALSDAGSRGTLGAVDAGDEPGEGPTGDELVTAAQALRNLAAPQAKPVLANVMRRAGQPLSGWAALALAALSDNAGVQRTIELSRGEGELAVAAITTLGACEHPAARKHLESLMAEAELQVALVAASSLSRPGNVAGLPALTDLCARGRKANDAQILSVAALGLGLVGDARSVRTLEELSNHPDRSVRRAAVVGLYYLTGQARRYRNMWSEDGRFEPLTFHVKLREEKLALQPERR